MTRVGLLASGFRRHKLRLVLTGLSIVVAFLLFSYLVAIRKAFEMGVDVAGADRMMVRHSVSIIQSLPTSYEAEIERVPGVVDATPLSWFGGIYQDPKNFIAQFAVEPESWHAMYKEFKVPPEQWKVGEFISRHGATWDSKGDLYVEDWNATGRINKMKRVKA